MIDWKAKLTSRKFWMAIIGFVTGLLTYLGIGAEQAEQLGSLILMGASVLAYIIGEGLCDAAGAHALTEYDDGWKSVCNTADCEAAIQDAIKDSEAK